MAFQFIIFTKTFVFLAFNIHTMVGRGQDVYEEAIDSTVSGCNPLVDVAFLLDGTSDISPKDFLKQKKFIHDLLGNHVAPAGAVKLGFVVCKYNRTMLLRFHPYKASTVDQLEVLSQNNASSNARESCIPSLRRLFKESGRHGVVKIALMIIAHHSQWSNDHSLKVAKAMKEEGITLLVVTVGRRNFNELHTMRNIASSDDKFFVLSSFNDLKKLASDLSTASCLPIALNPGPNHTPSLETTTLPETSNIGLGNKGTCKEVAGTNSYEKYIPFLGWLRMKCPSGTQIDVHDCNCKKVSLRKTRMKVNSVRPTSQNKIKVKQSDQQKKAKLLFNSIFNKSTIGQTSRDVDLRKENVELYKSEEDNMSQHRRLIQPSDISITPYTTSLSSSFPSSLDMTSSERYVKSSRLHFTANSSINKETSTSFHYAMNVLMSQTAGTHHGTTIVNSLKTELEHSYSTNVNNHHPNQVVKASRVIVDDLQYGISSSFSNIRPTLSSNYPLESYEVIDFFKTL